MGYRRYRIFRMAIIDILQAIEPIELFSRFEHFLFATATHVNTLLIRRCRAHIRAESSEKIYSYETRVIVSSIYTAPLPQESPISIWRSNSGMLARAEADR